MFPVFLFEGNLSCHDPELSELCSIASQASFSEQAFPYVVCMSEGGLGVAHLP